MDNPILWSLISVQVFMGAFDTLVHHEGTERLAWRASQRHELRLHGVRNFFYAVIFMSFAWLEPHGVFTIILAGILTVEVLITLWDFVEEDLTRKLPATERVNHTLLALNYGAILALAAPYLWAWSFMPTALIPINYGWWSVMATASAIGVGVFSARDPRKVDQLSQPVRVISNLDMIDDNDRIDVVVNLAGDAIAGGLWTAKKRAKIIASRVDMTRAVHNLIKRLNTKPDCLINGSAVGWYGLQDPADDTELAEGASAKPAFVHDVCAAWENECTPISDLGIRVVILRTGLVEFGLGGIMGHGQQWMPWIEHDDMIRVIAFAISEQTLSGPVNAVAPNPVRNDTFSRDLASALNRPLLVRFPEWLLTKGLGDLGRETMLGGQRVGPTRLIKHGFVFRNQMLAPTLRKITGARKNL